MHEGLLFINGEWIDGSDRFDSIDPTTGRPIGSAVIGSRQHTERAVAAARNALQVWGRMTVTQRASVLQKAVDGLVGSYGAEGEVTPLKQLITSEVGKRPPEADIEVIETSDMLAFFVNRGPELLAERQIELNKELWPTKQSFLQFDPVGVVGVISPWNYPLELPVWSIGAALIAGNTVVFKPSEHSPLVGLELGRIFGRAGLPKGVLNVVTGNGDTGSHLTTVEGVDMIAFTGSVSTGRKIAQACAKRLRKVVLELGGNDAAIVCADADLELAANGVIWGSLTNCGQVCVGIERVYVHSSIAEDFIDLLVSKTRQVRLGEDIGPLVSETQRRKVEDHLADAVAKGARILVGGQRPTRSPFDQGFFFEPTVLVNVDNSMTVMTEETFGPLLPVSTVQSDEQAIRLANDSAYGLGASVWTADQEKGRRLAKALDVGMVWINDVNVAFPECPWGGVKESGIGVALSDFGILEYVHPRHINIEQSADQTRAWWYPY